MASVTYLADLVQQRLHVGSIHEHSGQWRIGHLLNEIEFAERRLRILAKCRDESAQVRQWRKWVHEIKNPPWK